MNLWNGSSLAALIVVGVVGATAHAYQDAYPTGPFITGPASAALPWVNEDFDSYPDNQLIEISYDDSGAHHIDVNSGALWSKHIGPNKYGWTDIHNFRALAYGDVMADGNLAHIKWTDQIGHYRAMIDSWQGGLEDWSGLHVFGRYLTTDDLYVASMRYDGTATIKKKIAGTYTTLASGDLPAVYVDPAGHLKTGVWFDLKFSIIGTEMQFLIDDQPILAASDSSLTEGTTGIRTDHSTVFFDDWELIHTVIPELDGDLDGDGFVGITDLNIVLSAWNQSVPPGNPLADPSDDGFVGIEDLNVVLGNWNAGTPPSYSSVPEPGTLALLSLSGVAMLRRRGK